VPAERYRGVVYVLWRQRDLVVHDVPGLDDARGTAAFAQTVHRFDVSGAALLPGLAGIKGFCKISGHGNGSGTARAVPGGNL